MLSGLQQADSTVQTGFSWQRRRWNTAGVLILLVLILVGQHEHFLTTANAAANLDTQVLYDMAMRGEGAQALNEVRDNALNLGGWQAAPGDIVTYDATIANNVRGVVLAIDTPPCECADPRIRRLTAECDDDFLTKQNLVRFGEAMFSTPQPDGTLMPRAAPDDLISTYIEEVGHSWQEYFYETEGRAQGERVRQTSWETGLYLKHGWEYQVKAYILSLHGNLLTLSDDEHQTLLKDICNPNSYAHPLGYDIPPYGPPPKWPNPAGWPTTAPTQEELDTFCSDNPD